MTNNTRSCLSRRPLALLLNRRLDCGPHCFCLGLLCARGSRRSRRRRAEAPALTGPASPQMRAAREESRVNASLCAHLLHRICIGCSKLFRRTRPTGVGSEGDWSATDRGLRLLCTNVIRLDATEWSIATWE